MRTITASARMPVSFTAWHLRSVVIPLTSVGIDGAMPLRAHDSRQLLSSAELQHLLAFMHLPHGKAGLRWIAHDYFRTMIFECFGSSRLNDVDFT